MLALPTPYVCMLFLLAASPPPLRRAPPVMLSSATTAKSALRAALAASDGEPKAPEVLAAITELEPFSIPEPALSPLWAGDWRVITKPDFPDSLGRDAAGRYKFSLGRASFNMFAPQMLPVAIDSILNPSSAPAPGSPGAYEVIVKLDLLLPDASPLAATMENVAECTPVDGNPGRMAVKFGGGCLRPADGAPSEAWRDTFAAPGSSADLSRMQRFQLWVAVSGHHSSCTSLAPSPNCPARLAAHACVLATDAASALRAAASGGGRRRRHHDVRDAPGARGLPRHPLPRRRPEGDARQQRLHRHRRAAAGLMRRGAMGGSVQRVVHEKRKKA